VRKLVLLLVLICIGAYSLGQSNDAELVSYTTSISVKDGRLYSIVNVELKIFNRGGEKYSTVSIPYSKLIKVSKIEAYVKDGKGITVKKLQRGDIIERSAISDFSLYEDDFIKEFTLKHNSYPYSICYSYELQEDEYLDLAYWLPVLNRKVPTLYASLQIEIPTDFKISYSSKFINSTRIDTTNLAIKYTWVTSYQDLIEPEVSSPAITSLFPVVRVVPQNFKYNISGSFSSWQTFGDWHFKLLTGLSDLPESEKEIIINLVKGITDTKEKVRVLYHYLQDVTRYINITIETGGLKPYAASYVAANKYGDCKALSNYFKAVLDCVGIKSIYTKVLAGDQIVDTDKKFPSQQFNHIILCVPMPVDTIWLDCTSDGMFNFLGTFTQGRDVFLIKEGNSQFVRTPDLLPGDVAEIRRAAIHPVLQNRALAEFRNSYRGEKYGTFLYISRSLSETDRQRIVRNNYIENGFDLKDFKIIDPPRDSPEINFNYSASSDKVYKVYGNDLIIETLQFMIPNFETPQKRHLPVQIDYPVYMLDSLEYEIPLGYSVNEKIPDKSFSTDFGSYSIQSVLDKGKVKIVKSFLLFRGKYSLERYSDFYSFISKVIDIESNNIILTTKKF
jgi:hypothetical protein